VTTVSEMLAPVVMQPSSLMCEVGLPTRPG
jgi:hypothetical protein